MRDKPLRCPSSVCAEGATLLGVILPGGRVAFAQNEVAVTREFVDIARTVGPPERRFRFSSPCVQQACKQWANDRCSVIDLVIEEAPSAGQAEDLPSCSIRASCRWFAQAGRDACAVCPLVVTDQRQTTND